jgi:hypothetical protein
VAYHMGRTSCATCTFTSLDSVLLESLHGQGRCGSAMLSTGAGNTLQSCHKSVQSLLCMMYYDKRKLHIVIVFKM